MRFAKTLDQTLVETFVMRFHPCRACTNIAAAVGVLHIYKYCSAARFFQTHPAQRLPRHETV